MDNQQSNNDNVELLVMEGVQGRWPGSGSTMWDCVKLKIIMGFREGEVKWRRPPVRSVGWKFRSWAIAHATIGGVTDQLITIWAFAREEVDLREFLSNIKAVPAQLQDVLDKRVSGRRLKREDQSGAPATATRLLRWEDRFKSVRCVTVYSPDLIWRRLTAHELALAMDLPNARVKAFKGDLAALVRRVLIPGKFVQSAVGSFAKIISEMNVSFAQELETGDTLRDEVTSSHEIKAMSGDAEHSIQPGMEASGVVNNTTDAGAEGERLMSFAVYQKDETGASAAATSTEGPTSTVTSKAVKSDDAAAPVHLWDNFIMRASLCAFEADRWRKVKNSLELLRGLVLQRWKRELRKDFEDWFAHRRGPHLDPVLVRTRGEEAIAKAEGASFWTWDKGSSIFFWRWDPEYQKDVLEGGPVRFDREPDPWFKRASKQGTKESRELMKKKLVKFLDKGYIKLVDRDEVTSLINVFSVPKGDDIRPVFDGTKSGLNDCLYTPWFHLPGPDALTDELLPGYWNADNDYGEQFLNFPLNPQLMRFCGVDLTPYFPELSSGDIEEVIGMWFRNLMGLQCSPYLSVQGAQRAKRVILGDRFDQENPFQWACVRLNLPGDEDYDPTLPRVMRVRKDGKLATALQCFVDDLRTTAAEQDRAWLASTKIGKTLCWLGLQDAPRKRREPSQEPGAWAGVVVATTDGVVKKFVSEERWEKARNRIRWFAYMLYIEGVTPPPGADWSSVRKAAPKGHLEFKTGEQYVGFLRYVAQTYKSMVPYLKGIYLTLNSWRQHRDKDGWKLGAKVIEEALRHRDPSYHVPVSENAPKWVRIVKRLRKDVEALVRLTSSQEVPRINVRPTSSLVAYLVGDASGSGFGVALWIPGQKPIRFSHGVWDSDNARQSSNFRESANLILKLREYLEAGAIPRGAELFIFTDNAVAESAYHNGSSKVKPLHELALQLRELEMSGDLHVRAIWIAGTRMIECGVDGLSRGDLANGVLSGDMRFLAPLPLNKSAFERSPRLQEWVLEALQGTALPWIHLNKEGWFDEAFKNPIGAYVWSPPTAAAGMVVNSLCDVKHVHPDSSHMIFLPEMETQPWRKTLLRLSDCVVTLKPTSSLWGPEQHESINIAFISPFLSSSPFAVKRTSWVHSWEKELSEVWDSDPAAAGNCVREFWVRAWSDSTLVSRGLSREVLRAVGNGSFPDHFLVEDDPLRFQEARDGDHLLCPFQCDLCHFENIHSRAPGPTASDDWNMVCIRRANLDSMWARERSTVDSNRREGERYVRQAASFGKQDPFPARGPCRENDSWDMFAAMNVLSRSMDEGRNSKHVQFGTARKIRSCLSNYWHSSVDGIGGMVLITDGSTSRVSNSPTHSFWFHRFMEGCHRRMGDVWIPDRPLTIYELKCCLAILEKDWTDFVRLEDKEGMVETALTGCFIVAGFFAALRGEEICRMDIGAMRKHWEESQGHPEAPHVPLVMTGRFKRQIGEKFFCQPLANRSNSGVEIGTWISRALWVREQQGITTGPMFRVKTKGAAFRKATVSDLDGYFHAILRRVNKRWATVISDKTDIKEEYSVSRSLRRGATGEAQNAGIPAEVINENNRWRQSMRARGMTPTMTMRQRYSDAKACIKTLLRFSAGL